MLSLVPSYLLYSPTEDNKKIENVSIVLIIQNNLSCWPRDEENKINRMQFDGSISLLPPCMSCPHRKFFKPPTQNFTFTFFFKISFGIMIFTPKSRLLPKIVGISFDLTIHQDDMNVLFKKTINFVFS